MSEETWEETLDTFWMKRRSGPAYLHIDLAIVTPNDTLSVTTYKPTETHQRRRVVGEAPAGGQVRAPSHFAGSRPAITAHESVSKRPVVTNNQARCSLRNPTAGIALMPLATAPPRPTAPSRVGIVQHVVAPSALASALTTLVRATHFVPSNPTPGLLEYQRTDRGNPA